MSVQFILGRSGSGKTYFSLESLKKKLHQASQGPTLIMLVPAQATFQIEQAILADSSLKGYHRVRVMDFDRLAQQVLFETSPPKVPVLSETGKEMILRRLIQEHHSELVVFTAAAKRSGFIVQLSRIISELRQYQKRPDELLRQREELLKTSNASQTVLADKLADLALIFQAYQNYIADRFVEPDDFLDLMQLRYKQADIFRNADLWVDGFSGFTPQQYDALLSIISVVKKTRITFCLDPHSDQLHPDIIDLFHETCQTYRRLIDLLDRRGIELLPAITLPDRKKHADNMPRFKSSVALGRLEQNLCSEPSPAERNDNKPVFINSIDQIPTKDVVIVEASSRRGEVDAVARHIIRLCRQEGYRFRDIAVILRDFSDYQDLLEGSFEDHGIAYFLDQRRSVRHHPLVELLRSALGVINSDFNSELVFNYLKTDLPGLPWEVIDALENYVLAHGIQSSRWYEKRPWRLKKETSPEQTEKPYQLTNEQLNQYRREAIDPLLKMRENLYQQKYDPQKTLSVREITSELIKLIEKINVGKTLAGWHDQAQQDKDLDRAMTHQQVYTDVIAVLDDLVEALGDTSVTLAEYAEILNSALRQMTLALVPPALDQVLIGTIERSRHPYIRAAFVLGVNEGCFPRFAQAESILSDTEREKLNQDNFEVAPSGSEQLLHERYLGYIAFTRPTEFLWVSFPLADEAGTKLNPSLLIDNIRTALGSCPTARISDDHLSQADTITNPSQLARALAKEFSHYRHHSQINQTYAQLYHYSLNKPTWANVIQRSLAGLTYENKALLDPDTASRLFGSTLASSVSRLESFAACPFQHFARYTLALQERDQLKLAAIDLGSFFHEALCKIFHLTQADNLTWAQLTNEQIDSYIDRTAKALSSPNSPIAELLEQSQRNQYLINNAVQLLQRFCRALRLAAKAGNFRQQAAELRFGPDAPLPALEIDLTNARQLSLHGIIDRLDTATTPDGTIGLCVIDYKSSSRPFRFAHFYYGLTLQLITYLHVLQENYYPDKTKITAPAAALYLPVLRSGESKKEPPPREVLAGEKNAEELAHRAAGLYNIQWLNELDHTVAPGKYSAYFSFGIKKDGSIKNAKTSGVITPGEMSALLDYGRKKLIDLASRILDGDIAVSPYRYKQETPCDHCPFASLCRFDPASQSYRVLSDMTKPDVLTRIMSSSAEDRR